MKSIDYIKFLESELKAENIEKDEKILSWIKERNNSIKVEIKNSFLSKLENWSYDKIFGKIGHESGKFFSIEAISVTDGEKNYEQPIINQNEIGFLGIIVKEIDGIYYCLMQAKIEPGNINKVQISPTLQATRSNFQQVHKGRRPKYVEYFENVSAENVLYDTLQSEQGYKFIKKRNRNIIIKVNEDIEVFENYKWMSLRQIKYLMKYDNYVNMDTRTVISNIQYNLLNDNLTEEEKEIIRNKVIQKKFAKSMIATDRMNTNLIEIQNDINNIKMFNKMAVRKKSLEKLNNWEISNEKIYNKLKKDFEVIFCEIEIEGREVRKWYQPLIKPAGIEIIAFLIKEINGILHFLCRYAKEPGLFDVIEIGPTLNCLEENPELLDYVEKYTYQKIADGKNIKKSVLLSEEGGRFYHEENRNVILEIDDEFDMKKIPKGYKWLTLGQINFLIQRDNYVNIQARNLTAMISMGE